MTLLNEAWAILRDPQRRAAYDAAHGDSPTTATRAPQAPSSTGSKPSASRQPEWTGAAGKPPGRPWGGVLQFGIYSGWSVGDVARTDRGYRVWLRDRPEGQAFAAEIDRLLDPRGGGQGGPGRDPSSGRR